MSSQGSSFGIVCNCAGEGCDLGFNAVVTSEKNKTKISIQVPVSVIRHAKEIYESNNRNASGGPMAVILMVDRHECENFVKDKLRQNIARMNEEIAISSVLAHEDLLAAECQVERLAQKIMTSVYERLWRHAKDGLEKMYTIGVTF
jgi:L-lactate utilization protein LutC